MTSGSAERDAKRRKKSRAKCNPRVGRRDALTMKSAYHWADSLLRYRGLDTYSDYSEPIYEERNVSAEMLLLPYRAIGSAWVARELEEDLWQYRVNCYGNRRILDMAKHRSYTIHLEVKSRTKIYEPIPELVALRKRLKK